jgi:hypothetical protein
MGRPASGTVTVTRQRTGVILQFLNLADEPPEAPGTATGRKGQ